MKGELYLPSNGSEGECFIATFCEVCRKGACFRIVKAKSGCAIFDKAFFSGKHVKQWVYDENNYPVCTSFIHYQEKRPGIKKSKNEQPTLF